MRRIYYNEYDRSAAAWLRELMRKGLIAPGVVDERGIKEVSPNDLRGFDQCHFFAGIGGWSRALRLAGWPDDKPVWTGSCPCQSFSNAGARRGFDDPRHLWPELFRLIKECQPPTLFGEQVAAAIGFGWLDQVAGDLESEDYAVGATVFPAASVGAPHGRDRLYFVADSDRLQFPPELGPGMGSGSSGSGVVPCFWSDAEWVPCPDGKRRAVKPGVCPLADGVSGYMALMRGAGNAIVPQQAAEFIMAAVETASD
jgi:DNA (cytosine-5)-methyltransferase 1